MFNRLKIYTVHVKPGEGAQMKPVFVREGFNFYAFFLTLFWALYQRLWLPALALFAISVAFVFILEAHVLSQASMAAIRLGIHIMVGYLANDWLRARLDRQGYIVADVTVADSYLRAQQRYLERYVVAAS